MVARFVELVQVQLEPRTTDMTRLDLVAPHVLREGRIRAFVCIPSWDFLAQINLFPASIPILDDLHVTTFSGMGNERDPCTSVYREPRQWQEYIPENVVPKSMPTMRCGFRAFFAEAFFDVFARFLLFDCSFCDTLEADTADLSNTYRESDNFKGLPASFLLLLP